jgi:hypothetical protein
MIDAYDEDKDGRIDFREFVKLMETSSWLGQPPAGPECPVEFVRKFFVRSFFLLCFSWPESSRMIHTIYLYELNVYTQNLRYGYTCTYLNFLRFFERYKRFLHKRWCRHVCH